MGSQYDITITIKMSDPDDILYSKDIIDVIRAIESSLYKSDIEDIEWACKELNMTTIVVDASMERLRYFKNRRLKIYTAERGSIILAGVLIAVPLYILKNTIGESMKEAYKETNMHKKLKEIFRYDLTRKVESIIGNISKEINSKRHYKLKSIKHENIDPTNIFVEIERHMYEDKAHIIGTRNEEYMKTED